jgi:hypothetical protein
LSYKGLCTHMRRQVGGTVYKAVDDALRRLSNLHIDAYETWTEGPVKMSRATFPLLTYTQVETSRLGLSGNELKQLVVDFNPHVLNALASKYRLLDLDRYFGLKLPTSRRLYRYLEYRRHAGSVARGELALGLEELALELPLVRPQPSQVRLALDSALRELRLTSYLASAAVEARVFRVQFSESSSRLRDAKPYDPTDWLVGEICRVLKDGSRSQAFYQKAVKELGCPVVEILLGQVKELARTAPDRAQRVFSAAVSTRIRARAAR